MAEFLILAKDTLVCRRGDIVAVFNDGHSWGKEELNKDKFYILRVSDMSLNEAKMFIIPKDNPDGTLKYLRQYYLEINDLSPADQIRLSSDVLGKSKSDVLLKDKETGSVIDTLSER